MNKNFQFKRSKNGVTHVFLCNLCNQENEICPLNDGFKNEYLKINNEDCIELYNPTVDFVANQKYLEKNFVPHIIFIIDFSILSIKTGYINYVKYNLS